MAKSVGVPRAAWRLAPKIAASMTRRRFRAPVIKNSPEREDEQALQQEAAQSAAQGQFDTILDHVRRQLASRQTAPTGLRHSEATFAGLYAGLFDLESDPKAADKAAQQYRDWFSRDGQDPDIAALCARALQILTQFHHGGGTASRSMMARARSISNHLADAADIMESAAERGKTREIWHRTRFRGAALECDDPGEIADRFERFLRFDPGNMVTYFERTIQLLPRWHGDYEQVEAFAQDATHRTGEKWGAALYMMIYGVVSASEPMDKVHAQWDWILDGFEDALEVFPPHLVLNDFIRLAARMKRQDLVRQLFDKLPELRLDRWDDVREPFEVHAWANDRAQWPYGADSARKLA